MTITYKQTTGKIVESTEVRSLEYKQGLSKGEEPKLRVNGAADIPISKIASISLEESGVVIPPNLNDFNGQLVLVDEAAAIKTDVPLAYALNYSWTKGSAEPIVTSEPILKFMEKGITLEVVITSSILDGSITASIEVPLPAISGTLTLTGDVEVGSNLVASHATLENLVYQWGLVDDEGEWTPLEEATDTLELVAEYVDYYIGVRATHEDYSGYLETVTETVVVPLPAISGTLTLTGDVEVGSNLVASHATLENLVYQWGLVDDEGEWTPLEEATDTLELVAEYVDYYIGVRATHEDYSGYLETVTETVVVPLPAISGTLTLTGDVEVGSNLVASHATLENLVYQWGLVDDEGEWTPLEEATDTLELVAEYVDYYIGVRATHEDYSGYLETVTETVVVPLPAISGTLTLTGDVEVGSNLVASHATLENLVYQWGLVDDEGEWTPLEEATDTLELVAEYVDYYIGVRATHEDYSGYLETVTETVVVPLPAISGTLTLTGDVEVGSNLVASHATLENLVYQWGLVDDEGEWTPLEEATDTLELVAEYVDYYIGVRATHEDYSGYLETVTETVVVPLPAISGTLTLTGDVEVGSNLVASHATLENLVYQWGLVDDEGEWTPLEEATDTLELVAEYVDYYIGVRATHEDYSGYLETVTETVVVPLPAISGTLTLTGDVEVGSNLVASHATLENLVYQWGLVDDEGEWTPLEEATDTLELVAEYVDYYIGVRATHEDYSGYLETVTETVVIHEDSSDYLE